MSQKALITGISGQDGSYLAELLIQEGWDVIGIVRRTSHNTYPRLKGIINSPRLTLVEGDITDPHFIFHTLNKYFPKHIYNLAAQSHVGTSFSEPAHTLQVTGLSILNILEACRGLENNDYHPRIYQASSSEMFGSGFSEKNGELFQDEYTTFQPVSPYGIAKLTAYHLIRMYRYAYNMFAVNGILHNHDSPRRGHKFVTRKITSYIGRLMVEGDSIGKLSLGDTSTCRDFGHAKDYVKAMYLMLSHTYPHDYVVGTGVTHSIAQFADAAFKVVGLNASDYIVFDEQQIRPAEVHYLKASASFIKEELGWQPSVTFNDLVKEMVEHDIKEAQENLRNQH